MTSEGRGAVSPEHEQRMLLRELAERAGLSEDEVLELVDCGAIAVIEERSGQRYFSVRSITVARMARRLRDDFDVEPHAAALMLLFVERIRALERELDALRARLPR
jgi:chaperone modulatory protein CbpM